MTPPPIPSTKHLCVDAPFDCLMPTAPLDMAALFAALRADAEFVADDAE